MTKDPELRRIVVLGDSYTFGLGLPLEETYPKVLERLLNKSTVEGKPRYEVLNWGVIGYGSEEEALVLQYKALAWDPDVVIVGYVLNDPETDPIDNPHAYSVKPHWWQYFNVFRLVARAKQNWDVKRLGGGDYYKYLHAERGEEYMQVVHAFNEIRELTSPRGIKVLVVIFPIVAGYAWQGSWAEYAYKGIHKQVGDLARSNGFQVIDLYEVFLPYAPRDTVLSRWDEHPSRLGHELAARAIAKMLSDEHSTFFTAKHESTK